MAETKKPEIIKSRDIHRSIRLDPIDEKLTAFAEKGVFLIGGPILEGVTFSLLLSIGNLHKTEPDKEIWLILKSPGGQVDEGFAMYDLIRAFVKKGLNINILCMGLVASMGAGILQAAKRRYSLPSTQFMIHEVSQVIMATENASESDERNAEIKRINNIVLGQLADRTGLDIKELAAQLRKTDVWLDAKAALKFGSNGLIDEIVDTLPFEL